MSGNISVMAPKHSVQVTVRRASDSVTVSAFKDSRLTDPWTFPATVLGGATFYLDDVVANQALVVSALKGATEVLGVTVTPGGDSVTVSIDVAAANALDEVDMATQAELNAGLAGKQDAATAATDAELAAGLAGKQDAATAATDAELAAAIAGRVPLPAVPTAIANATGGLTIDVEARAALNAALGVLRTAGLIT